MEAGYFVPFDSTEKSLIIYIWVGILNIQFFLFLFPVQGAEGR